MTSDDAQPTHRSRLRRAANREMQELQALLRALLQIQLEKGLLRLEEIDLQLLRQVPDKITPFIASSVRASVRRIAGH